MKRKASVDVLVIVVGVLTIIGGILYLINQSWGLLTVTIALLIEAVKQVIR